MTEKYVSPQFQMVKTVSTYVQGFPSTRYWDHGQHNFLFGCMHRSTGRSELCRFIPGHVTSSVEHCNYIRVHDVDIRPEVNKTRLVSPYVLTFDSKGNSRKVWLHWDNIRNDEFLLSL